MAWSTYLIVAYEGLRLADSKRRRGRSFGSVRKLGSGRWQARYHDATGRRHCAPQTFAAKADAARYLATVEADMLRGVWTDPSLGMATFAEWVQQWQATATQLRPSTVATYDYLLRRFLMPAFAEVPLGRLDVLAVRGWLASLHRDGEVTPTTIAKAYRLLRRILAVAVEAGYLPRNPCTVKGAGVERTREMRHVSVPELLRLAGLVPDRYRTMVLLAGFGGLRWGELVGLRRRHVELADATVTVAGQVTEVGGRFIAGPPKTSAGLRTVPLPVVGMTALVEHLDRHAQPGPDGCCSRPRPGDTCSEATSAGRSGSRRSPRPGWRGCGSMTCGTRPRRWRRRLGPPPGN